MLSAEQKKVKFNGIFHVGFITINVSTLGEKQKTPTKYLFLNFFFKKQMLTLLLMFIKF